MRLVHNAATTAFFIWVIAGGLDAYAGTYDAIGRRFGIEVGTADALALTFAEPARMGSLREHGAGAGVPARPGARGSARRRAPAHDRTWRSPLPDAGSGESLRFSLRIPTTRGLIRAPVALAAAAAFVLLLSSTEWVLIAAVSGWLVAAWLLSRPDSGPLRAGLLFAAILATGAFVFAIGGGLGLDAALRRALRAALVLTATWLGPPPAPAGSARSRGGRSAGFERSRPRSRRRRCSRRSPPRDGPRGRRGRSSRG